MSKTFGCIMSSTRCALCNIYIPPEPVVLLACGSFNPITTMHLRMMELARDKLERTWSISKPYWNSILNENSGTMRHLSTGLSEDFCAKCQTDDVIPRRQVVIGGVFSPVSDAYNKAGLAPARVRVELVRTACTTASDWLVVNPWESQRSQWSRTRVVIDNLQSLLNRVYEQLVIPGDVPGPKSSGECKVFQSDCEEFESGVLTESWLRDCLSKCGFPHTKQGAQNHPVNREQPFHTTVPIQSVDSHDSVEPEMSPTLYPRPRVKLVCGADLLESFAVPNLWATEDIEVLARDYGIVCISRPKSDAERFVFQSEILSKYESNITLVTEWCQNALSATMVRRALSLGQTVRYLVPDAVLEKIYQLGLYGARRPTYNVIGHHCKGVGTTSQRQQSATSEVVEAAENACT